MSSNVILYLNLTSRDAMLLENPAAYVSNISRVLLIKALFYTLNVKDVKGFGVIKSLYCLIV